MKVLLVSNNLKFGGKERQIVELLSAFSQYPEHSFGIVLREGLIQYDIDFADKITIFKPKKRLGFKEIIKFHKEAIKQFRPDVIHTWESGGALSMTLINILSGNKIPIIDGSLRYSKTYSKKKKYYWVVRFNRALAKKIITNSNAGANSIDYGKNGKKIVIPNGMNLNRFNNLNSGGIDFKETVNIGMVSSFSRPKDYKTLVNAALLLLEENINCHFTLVGEGPEKKGIEELIPSNKAKYFTFTGALSKPEQVMANFNIGVLLSKIGHSEGLSNAVMEYLALGLPVVCTKTGGNVELVEEGKNGFLVPHESVEQVTEKLKTLVNNKELRVKMGKISKSIAFEKYDINITAQQYLNLYQSVIKK